MFVPSKTILKSKTFWLNITGLGVLILEDLVDLGLEYAWIAIALVVLNAINRFYTVQPVSLTGKNEKYVDTNGTP